MEDDSRSLLSATAAAIIIGVAVLVILVVLVILFNMDPEEKTDYEWKSPSLTFTDGVKIPGSAVVSGISSFEGYAVKFTVITLDGTTSEYNFDGQQIIDTYDRNCVSTVKGYINPSGTFLVREEADDEGKTRHVILTQQ